MPFPPIKKVFKAWFKLLGLLAAGLGIVFAVVASLHFFPHVAIPIFFLIITWLIALAIVVDN